MMIKIKMKLILIKMGICETVNDKSLKKTSSVQNEKKIFRDKLESLNSENEIKTERLYSKKKKQ